MEFLVVKVNGRDLSRATHEEAVEAFRHAKEPIIVQVMRQCSAAPQASSSAASPMSLSTTTGPRRPLPAPPQSPKPQPQSSQLLLLLPQAPPQMPQSKAKKTTDEAVKELTISCHANGSGSAEVLYDVPAAEGEYVTSNCSGLVGQQYQPLLCLPGHDQGHRQQHQRQHQQQNNRQRHLVDYEHQALDCGVPGGSLTPSAAELFFQAVEEFDYEEVKLTREKPGQKLGLTLCYSPVDGSCSDQPLTDVFIGEVTPDSVAAKSSSRVRVGDQILRINGEAARTRDQAVRLFANAGQTVTLLLARPRHPGLPDDLPLSDETMGEDDEAEETAVVAATDAEGEATEVDGNATEEAPEAEEAGGAPDAEAEETRKDSGLGSAQSSTSAPPGTAVSAASAVSSAASVVDDLTTAVARLRTAAGCQQQQQQQQRPAVPRMGTRVQQRSPNSQQQQPPPQSPTLTPTPTPTLMTTSSASTACQTVAAGDNTADDSAASTAMEWVLKRRADGTRYVTRRPVRARLLRERARRLTEERAGAGTDDDLASCLGRWAPRHERKRQLRQHRAAKAAAAVAAAAAAGAAAEGSGTQQLHQQLGLYGCHGSQLVSVTFV